MFAFHNKKKISRQLLRKTTRGLALTLSMTFFLSLASTHIFASQFDDLFGPGVREASDKEFWPFFRRQNLDSISEQDFFNVLIKMENLYRPLFRAEKMKLKIKKLWASEQLNTVSGNKGAEFFVTIPGGLARRPSMTVDSLALAVCHEIGHFLGGAPRYREYEDNSFWSSAEGQADYFATAKCLKKVFALRSENVAFFRQLDPLLKKKIKRKCRNYRCARIVAASLSLMKTIQEIEGAAVPVRLLGPDDYVTSRTQRSHPGHQCRLDTLVAGAACQVDVNLPFGKYDADIGACVRDTPNPEEIKGARPLCWYRPL